MGKTLKEEAAERANASKAAGGKNGLSLAGGEATGNAPELDTDPDTDTGASDQIDQTLAQGPQDAQSMNVGASTDVQGNEIDWFTVQKDPDGQQYLPGQEKVVPRDFYQVLKDQDAVKKEHSRLTKKLTEYKEDVSSMSRKYRDLFRENESKILELEVAGFVVEVEIDTVETVKTHRVAGANKTTVGTGAPGDGGKKPTPPGKQDF